ncbi:MAG: ferredoxin [Actinobacteria bacterium]|nr:ferredoxin [Actinomycetota bacterium]
MKIVVDMDLCADHGQCVYAAPDVFQLDDNGKLVYKAEADESQRDLVEEAADVCPMQAISIED